jgi:hypothetical protein
MNGFEFETVVGKKFSGGACLRSGLEMPDTWSIEYELCDFASEKFECEREGDTWLQVLLGDMCILARKGLVAA